MNEQCNCLHHAGLHWQHLDALYKAKNHALLVQACRYAEATRASRDVAEVALLCGAFDAIMRQYGMEELARLDEKARHVK